MNIIRASTPDLVGVFAVGAVFALWALFGTHQGFLTALRRLVISAFTGSAAGGIIVAIIYAGHRKSFAAYALRTHTPITHTVWSAVLGAAVAGTIAVFTLWTLGTRSRSGRRRGRGGPVLPERVRVGVPFGGEDW